MVIMMVNALIPLRCNLLIKAVLLVVKSLKSGFLSINIYILDNELIDCIYYNIDIYIYIYIHIKFHL